MGNLFSVDGSDDDRAYSLWHATSRAKSQSRWWASIALFTAYFPLFILYFIWLPLTCMGKIKAANIDENKSNKNNLDDINNDYNDYTDNMSIHHNIHTTDTISTHNNPLYQDNINQESGIVENVIIDDNL